MRLTEFTSRVSSRHLIGAIALVTAFFSMIETSYAARVTQVKGSQVLIDLEGEDANSVKGKRYIVMVDGKRKAIVQITKAKGGKAVGKILKGKAAVDGTLVAVKAKKSRSTETADAESDSSDSSSEGSDTTTYGVLLGMNMASQSVTLAVNSVNETVKMAGNGFSLKAFGDFNISGDLSLLGRAGMEQFNVTGQASDATRKTEILYLTGDLLVKYQFMNGSFRPFVIGGLGLHFPLSKTSDALEASGIAVTTVLVVGGGANYYISDTMYLVGTAEYGYFPPSTDVTTSWMAFRGGLGMQF
ncbi:MAG: hypothetical protein V4692_10720 [Bdellovibrionota bacterium]